MTGAGAPVRERWGSTQVVTGACRGVWLSAKNRPGYISIGRGAGYQFGHSRFWYLTDCPSLGTHHGALMKKTEGIGSDTSTLCFHWHLQTAEPFQHAVSQGESGSCKSYRLLLCWGHVLCSVLCLWLVVQLWGTDPYTWMWSLLLCCRKAVWTFTLEYKYQKENFKVFKVNFELLSSLTEVGD